MSSNTQTDDNEKCNKASNDEDSRPTKQLMRADMVHHEEQRKN